MGRDVSAKAGGLENGGETLSDGVVVHGPVGPALERVDDVGPDEPVGGEEPGSGWLCDDPVAPEEAEVCVGESDGAGLSALSVSDVDEAGGGVDVGDLEVAGLCESEAGGEEGFEEGEEPGPVAGGAEDGANFLGCEGSGGSDGGDPGPGNAGDHVGALEGVDEEELERSVVDGAGLIGELAPFERE